jgi:hypothetical protein
LIECIRELQKLHENDSYSIKRYNVRAYNFEIINVQVHIEVEDYHDGKERIVVRYIEK